MTVSLGESFADSEEPFPALQATLSFSPTITSWRHTADSLSKQAQEGQKPYETILPPGVNWI